MRVRAMDFVGVISPNAVQVAEPRAGDPSLFKTVVPGAAVGVAGALVWEKHRLLGFLLGESLGSNAYRVWRGQGADRVRAGTNVVVAGAAAVGSLSWQKHPFWGWVLGFVGGAVATSLVPGSNAHYLRTRIFR